ncbi:glycoside hydrolase superfamily [Xylariaceae sp. FL0804]|nr:glycoside hydrolase superfamily [Xylariaceae sp. FL0804]
MRFSSSAFQAVSALSLISSVGAASNSSASGDSAILADGNVNLGIATAAYEKAAAFVAQLNNTEKVALITAQDLDGAHAWTALANKDGVAGINFNFFVSGFPLANALAMTWDRARIEQQFRAVGDEFYQMGYNLINGPVAGPLGRVPEGGRLAEGFSPDPYLSGIAMGRATAGMNAAGVITAGRHFLFNEQETNRMQSTEGWRYSSNADDKTAHELYLLPFADAVHEGLMAVMCGMNRVNDTLSCENGELLDGWLKTDLGFPGLVFPDVSSQQTAFGSANAGLDYGSSSIWSEATIEAGLKNGSLTQARLDDMAVRNVIGYYHVGLDDGRQPGVAGATEYRDVRADHARLIRQVAGEAIALLKNDNADGRGLPLDKPRTMALFGAHAGPAMAGPNQGFSVSGTTSDVYQGHLASGGGSGQLSMPYLITPFQALSAQAIEDDSMIWWIMNDTYTASSSGFPGGGGGFPSGGFGGNGTNSTMPGGGMGGFPGGGDMGGGGGGGGNNLGNLGQGTAVNPSFETYAENAEVCLCFLNANAGEGADRSSLSDDDQDAMVNTVASSCNNTVVVVNTVGPRVLDAWADHANVTAVLYAGLLGQNSGLAIADVLYGRVNPSAKLSHTVAHNASDYPVGVCETEECDFDEGSYIDYRHFDARNASVRYPFGHGLSYTSFAYGAVTASFSAVTSPSNTTIRSNSTSTGRLTAGYATGPLGLGGPSDLWDEVATVGVSVGNTGARAGSEVAQLYVSFPAAAAQPVRVLRGFEKVGPVAPGATAEVTFGLRRRDLSYWDAVAQEWAVAAGEYTFAVGSSSRDIRGSAKLRVV